MISRCANPTCGHSFHSLAEGRLFHFEVRQPSEPCRDIPATICRKRPQHATIYFWLCADCAGRFTLRFQPHAGVSLVRLEAGKLAAPAAAANAARL